MSNVTPPSIGNIITSPVIRKAVYGVYGVLAFVVAAIQVGFSSLNEPNPSWLTVALAVIGFAAVPVGTLAISNTNNASVAAIIPVPTDSGDQPTL